MMSHFRALELLSSKDGLKNIRKVKVKKCPLTSGYNSQCMYRKVHNYYFDVNLFNLFETSLFIYYFGSSKYICMISVIVQLVQKISNSISKG